MCRLLLDLLLKFLLFSQILFLLLLEPLLFLPRKDLVLLVQLLLLLYLLLLQTLCSQDFLLARLLRGGRLREWLNAFLPILLDFGPGIGVHASVNNFAELVQFLHSLLVFLFHLPNDLERSMLLTEHPVGALTINALHLKEVVGSSGALNVERDHAATIVALDASALTLPADDTLEVEAFNFDLAHTDWGLRRHSRAWYPHGTAQVDPLVESISRNSLGTFKSFFISLQEECVVFWDLSDCL